MNLILDVYRTWDSCYSFGNFFRLKLTKNYGKIEPINYCSAMNSPKRHQMLKKRILPMALVQMIFMIGIVIVIQNKHDISMLIDRIDLIIELMISANGQTIKQNTPSPNQKQKTLGRQPKIQSAYVRKADSIDMSSNMTNSLKIIII